MAKYGIKNPIFKPSPIVPTYNDYLIFEGISVDEQGKQHYLDVNIAYRQTSLNAIEYLTKFGYSPAQAYAILGTAPCQGHNSGVVDIPNACASGCRPTSSPSTLCPARRDLSSTSRAASIFRCRRTNDARRIGHVRHLATRERRRISSPLIQYANSNHDGKTDACLRLSVRSMRTVHRHAADGPFRSAA